MKKTALSIFIVLGVCLLADANGEQRDFTIFLQANQAYENGDYAAAARGYERLLSLGLRTGDIYYNLGNAYLKNGSLGLALLNYRMAERYMPRDADLEANVQYALDQSRDKIDCSGNAPFWHTFFFWFYKFTGRELGYALLCSNFIFWALLGIKYFLRTESLGIVASMALFFTVLFGASLVVKYYQTAQVKRAVVLAQEIQVRSGSGLRDTVLFKLHEGTEMTVDEEDDAWAKITLCDGKMGWVQKSSIGILPGH